MVAVLRGCRSDAAFWAVDGLLARKAARSNPLLVQFTSDTPVSFTVAILGRNSRLVGSGFSAPGPTRRIMKKAGAEQQSFGHVITRVLVVGQIARTAALLIAATLQIKSIPINQARLRFRRE